MKASTISILYLLTAKAATKCWSCMKLDENTNITRPWKCGQDGATMVEETCGERAIGCVSEHGENNRDRLKVKLVC